MPSPPQPEQTPRIPQETVAQAYEKLGIAYVKADILGNIIEENRYFASVSGSVTMRAGEQGELQRKQNLVGEYGQLTPEKPESVWHMQSSDGQWYQVHGRGNFSPEGNLLGFETVYVDVTETVKTVSQGMHNSEAFRAADAIAHDLRGPLANAKGYNELAKMGIDALQSPNTETQQGKDQIIRLLEKADVGNQRAVRIIEAYLSLMAMDAGGIKTYPVDMDAIVHAMEDHFMEMGKAKQARIKIEPSMPRVLATSGLVERVWENLVSNAIRYGGDRPDISLSYSTMPDGRVRYVVVDSGPGISQEDQELLFKEFSQLNEGKRMKDGLGLGLALVKKIVESLGGEVGVESEVGKGSTFYFILSSAEKRSRKTSPD